MLLCGALALAIGASILLRGRRRVAHLLFACVATDMGLWYLAQSLYGLFQASPKAGLKEAVKRLGQVPEPHVGGHAGEEQMRDAAPPPKEDRRPDRQSEGAAEEHRPVTQIHDALAYPSAGPKASST